MCGTFVTDIRQREMRKAAKRQPELEGCGDVDRRSVYAALKWGARRNKEVPAYHRGIIKGIIAGAATF